MGQGQTGTHAGAAPPKLNLGDRVLLRMSTIRIIDGIWVASTEEEPYPGLCRVFDALQLIRERDPLNYARIVQHLRRIWIRYIPSGRAVFDQTLAACIIDDRYLLPDVSTREVIASTIVHEATHARLERWGFSYVEARRVRLEAICLQRELSLLARLPGTEALREEIAHAIVWYAEHPEELSNASFDAQLHRDIAATLRHLGLPAFLIALLFNVSAALRWARRAARTLTRRA